MAKAIYTMKMELLLEGNETVIQLKAHERLRLEQFNRFVVLVYIQSWFASRCTVHAQVNDICLIGKLMSFDDDQLQNAGLKMMKRHSWYLSPKLANLALFSQMLSCDEKPELVKKTRSQCRRHLLTKIPNSITDLQLSETFNNILDIDDGFLEVPVQDWPDTQSYIDA
jgi:hypothetical protein